MAEYVDRRSPYVIVNATSGRTLKGVYSSYADADNHVERLRNRYANASYYILDKTNMRYYRAPYME